MNTLLAHREPTTSPDNPQQQLLQCLLAYEPIIDRKRSVMALRLKAQPVSGAAPPVAALYAELSRDWPAQSPVILLSAPHAVLDEQILQAVPGRNVWLEVPADATSRADTRAAIAALQRKGFSLVLSGRTPEPLPASLLSAFKMSIIHVDDDRRLNAADHTMPAGVKRVIAYAQAGVRSIEKMESCFETGAYAVLGWPMEDAITYRERPSSAPDYLAIMQLIAMADRGDDSSRMEAVIRRDPAIAYRLLRYINSVGFGLSVQVQSFRHAIMMLGYKKLKRWLALLLATSSRDANMRPVMLASFRRGLLLEELLGETGDETMRDEIFILGVFSLLDKLMKKPFGELFGNLAVPDSVNEALVHGAGPFVPYLRIVECIENGPDARLQDYLDGCLITLADCNLAVLRTLKAQELHQG